MDEVTRLRQIALLSMKKKQSSRLAKEGQRQESSIGDNNNSTNNAFANGDNISNNQKNYVDKEKMNTTTTTDNSNNNISHLNHNESQVQHSLHNTQQEHRNVDDHHNHPNPNTSPTNGSPNENNNENISKSNNHNDSNNEHSNVVADAPCSTKLVVSSSVQEDDHRVDEDGDIEMLGNEDYVSELNKKDDNNNMAISTSGEQQQEEEEEEEEAKNNDESPTSNNLTNDDTSNTETKSATRSLTTSHPSSPDNVGKEVYNTDNNQYNDKQQQHKQQQQTVGENASPTHLIPPSPQSQKVQELYQMLKRRQEQKSATNTENAVSHSTIPTIAEPSRLGALISSESDHNSAILAVPPAPSVINFHPAPFSQIPFERSYPLSSPASVSVPSSQFDTVTLSNSSDNFAPQEQQATISDSYVTVASQNTSSNLTQQQMGEEEEDDFTKMLMLHKAKKNETAPVLDTSKKVKKNRRAHKKKNKQNKARNQRSLQITTGIPQTSSSQAPALEQTGPLVSNESTTGNQEIVDMDLSSPVDMAQQNILVVNTDSPVSSTTVQPPNVITEDDVNSIHNPAEFQQKNASLTSTTTTPPFEPLRPPGVVEQSTSLQGFGRMPPKRFFVSAESNQRPYFSDSAPPLLPPPHYHPGAMPVHFQHMQRTQKRSYPPPASVLPPQMPVPPPATFSPAYQPEHPIPTTRKLLVRFDDSSSDESENEADEMQLRNGSSNETFHGMRHTFNNAEMPGSMLEFNEHSKRVRPDYSMEAEPLTPPRKRARKERLKNFEPVDEMDVALLQEEVAVKQNQLEEIREDLKQKESTLLQATEQMYAHEEKRIALEAKRKLLLAQLKEVTENIDICIKDRDTFKMKINLHENIVQKKKEQLKKAMTEYKEANLELYEVQLHNSILSEAARHRDQLSDLSNLASNAGSPTTPTVQLLQKPTPPVIRTPTVQQRKATISKNSPQFNGATSFYPSQKKNIRPVTPPGPHAYQLKNRTEVASKSDIEKKKEFLQNKKRLDELKAEIEEKKKHEALLRKKIGHPVEEEFISLSVPDDDKVAKLQEAKEHKEIKEPLTSPPDVRDEEEISSQMDDAAGMADQIFKENSTLFFVGECGGRLLFAPRGQHEKESFFYFASEQLKFQTNSPNESSKEEKVSSSSNLTPFTRYESPLNAFRVYRSTSLFSLTTSNSKPTASAAPQTVDYDRFLCRNDLDGRRCTDPNCTYQHMEDYEQQQDDGKSTFGKITDALRRGKSDKPVQKKPMKTHGVKYSSGNKKRDLRVIDEYVFDKNIRTLIANQTKTESRYYDKISSQEYEHHLEQYPSDIAYWIKFALKKIIEHENNIPEGITLALSVLSRGLEKNPRSHDLWLVYCDLYTSKLNPTADNDELQDIFTAATKKIGHSILMWFKIISTVPQLDEKLGQIDRAINIFRQNGAIEQEDRSRFLIALMYEKLRVLCAAGKFEEAVNAVKGTYETPVITLNDDEEEEEQPSDISTILTALHRSNLWLLAITIHWKKEFPFAGHFVGSDFLALVDKPLGINFTPDIEEEVRNDIARMLDMGLNLFSHMGSDSTNRDALLLQLNKHYFLSISEPDFRMADKHFNDLFQRLKDERDNMLDKKPSHEIPERLTLHLDRVEERCKSKREANTITALGQFYDGINRKMIKNDTYLWYKTILFFAQNQSLSQIVPSLWSYLYSYYDNITVEDVASFNKSQEEMVLEASDMMRNLLGIATSTIKKNQLTGLWHYNPFAWLVYIVLEAIREQNKDAVKHIFEEALIVFGNFVKEKRKILEEYVEFMSMVGTREEYEGVVDMCLNQDMIYPEAMKQVPLTVELTKENPLLRALVSNALVKDFVFPNYVLQRLLQSVDPKLKGDIFENALGLLQGDTAVAIKWAKHEFSLGNCAIAKVILYKIVSTKPQALDVWDLLLQISSLYARKHNQKESQKDMEEVFEKMMKENPFLPYKNFQEYMANRCSQNNIEWYVLLIGDKCSCCVSRILTFL